MAFREYGKDAMKKLQQEARVRRQEELAKKREEKRLKELEEYERKKELRHLEWAKKGNQYFERKIAEEKARKEAAEFRRQEELRKKKEQQEEKKRLAEAYAARMEVERLKEEARQREIARRTRWYDDGSRYVGGFIEEPLYKGGLTNTLDRRDHHRTPHGHGTFYAGSKVRYEGEWFYGQRHGKGILRCPDGSVYSGRFRHGERHGIGVWEKMTAEACARKEAAEAKAATEAYTVTETFTLPPRKCVFWMDSFVCWWDDLIVGQAVRFCLRNSYNSLSNEQWFHATIVEVIPDDDGEPLTVNGRNNGGENTDKGSDDNSSGGVDAIGMENSYNAQEHARPDHWPKNKKLKHRIVCSDERPWRTPRWVDFGKLQFKLAEKCGKVAPICNLPELGLQMFPARKDHLGRLEEVSDPLTQEFKDHIRYKLDCASREKTVPNRETIYGAAGTAGAPAVSKTSRYK